MNGRQKALYLFPILVIGFVSITLLARFSGFTTKESTPIANATTLITQTFTLGDLIYSQRHDAYFFHGMIHQIDYVVYARTIIIGHFTYADYLGSSMSNIEFFFAGDGQKFILSGRTFTIVSASWEWITLSWEG